MRTQSLLCAVAIVSLISGCRYGVSARTFPPALGPNGVTIRVSTENQQFVGELLEVRDTAFVLLSNRTVRLLPYSVIVEANARGGDSTLTVRGGRPPDSGTQEKLRLLSRFPQGLSPELLGEVLSAHGQTDLADASP